MPQKDPNKLTKKNYYQNLIIGGGIVGCGIFRDLSLHGLEVCLIEKGDFNSQTSQGSSKMLHGGIRYLENLDFGLVKEALEEKNLWLRLTPHLCYEKSFHMPNYSFSKYPFWAVRLGFHFYDFLSHYQNSPSYHLSRAETMRLFPTLNSDQLRGCGVYYDGIVDDAKLGLECLYDGLLEPQSEAYNYVEVECIERRGPRYLLNLKDRITQQRQQVLCENLIVAAGPFTDQLMKRCQFFHWKPKLSLSKGIHIWIDKNKLPLQDPIVVQAEDNRVIFIIPYQDSVLVGTTESPVVEDIFDIQANRLEIDYLLDNLRFFFPKIQFQHKDILSSYAAVRPLVHEGGGGENLGKISRVHKVYSPFTNLSVIVGGKYTTFRRMAQDIARPLCLKQKVAYNANKTLAPLRQRSEVLTFAQNDYQKISVQKVIDNEKVRTFDDLLKRRFSVASAAHWEARGKNFDEYFKPYQQKLPTVAKP